MADLTGLFSWARLDPGRRGLAAVAIVAVLVALVVGGWVLAARPHPIPMAATLAGPPTGSLTPGGTLQSPVAGPATAGSATTVPVVVVDIAGKVRRPGVYRLGPGARVSDAVAAAGGMLTGVDPASVNLARKVADGEQILVGVVAPAGPGSSGFSGSLGPEATTGGGAAGLIDLNTATAGQLDALPGVGPVLAQRIVDWRSQHGRFDSVDQLNDVSGIGESKFSDLKALVTVS